MHRSLETAALSLPCAFRLALVAIDGDFGGWKKSRTRHFDEGGTCDAIFAQVERQERTG